MNFAKTHWPKLSILLLFTCIASIYTFPIFQYIHNWGIQDWDQHLFYHAVPRKTIVEYGQIPLWNPYYVGGTVMLANPQSRLLAPTYLFHLLVGEVIGIKIEIWLHIIIGLLGGYALARYYQLNKLAAILSACVFMLGTMYALPLSVGMTWFLSVAYLSWIFLFYLKALTNLRYALLSGVFLCLMFFSGGAYPLAITLLFLGTYSFFLVIFRTYSLFRLSKVLTISVLFMLCLGAVKFFPTIEFQQTHPRPIYDYSGYSLNSLRYSLFSRDQTLASITNLPIEQAGFINGVTGGMDENGMYIGLIPFSLFVVGIGLNDKRRMILFLSLLIFLWLSFGSRPQAELWTILHLFPVYDSMRVAQRFRIIFMLCLAIFVGFGLQTIQHYLAQWRLKKPWTQYIPAIIVVIVVVDLLWVSQPVLAQAFTIPPLPVTQSSEFYQIWELPVYNEDGWITEQTESQTDDPFAAYNPFQINSTYSSLLPAFLQNQGTINGYETANVPQNALSITDENYQGEVYLKNTNGVVETNRWSPNQLVVDVDVTDPDILIINQNYYAGWHVNFADGRAVENIDGYLAVQVLPADSQVELHYLPTSFVLGVVVSTITVIVSLILGLRWAKSHLLRRN